MNRKPIVNDNEKTKDELTTEVAALRAQVAELERNATVYKSTDKVLRENELRYRRLFETARDGIVLLSGDSGRIIDISPSFISLSGYGTDDLMGKPFWEIRPLAETDAGLVMFKELQVRERIYYDDLPFCPKDGSRISVELIGSAHAIGSERVLQCTVRDISRRKSVEEELWKAESRFRALFNKAAIAIGIVDAEGRIIESNPALESLLGYPEKELIGAHFTDFTHPEDLEADTALFRELLAKKRDSYQAAIRCIRKDGGIVWGLLAVSLIRDRGGEPLLAIRMIENITDRKRAEETIVKSRDFYLSLIDELPNPIRRTDADGKCDYFNKAWLVFTGRKMNQEIGDGWVEGVHAEDRERLTTSQEKSFNVRSSYVTEYRIKHYTGEYRWIVEYGRPYNEIDGSFGGYISSCYDVQDRKSFEETLRTISTTDELTGLLNRRGFFTLAQQEIRVANRNKNHLLLFYMDLDGMKKINDTLGHPEGDLALVEAASVLKEIFRESDIIGRLGGDEFAVLIQENASSSDAEVILDRLRDTLRERNDLPGRRYTLAISAGVKSYDPENPCSLDELLSRADTRMYLEKQSKYRAKRYPT
jgi:diguanylate cyclase (GGDEF)-like protein/PAS domain S-box-containing protein